MKKIVFFAFALFFAVTVNAQKVVTDDVDNTATTTTSTAHGNDEEVNYMNSGGGLDYMAVDDGFGLGINYVFGHVLVDLSYVSQGNDYYDSSCYTIGVGGQYRYWFNKTLFIEGRAGIHYRYGTFEFKLEDEKTSDGKFGMFITPRIGLRLFKVGGNDLSLVAGYRWDFNEFKFNKENTADYFTVGLAWVF